MQTTFKQSVRCAAIVEIARWLERIPGARATSPAAIPHSLERLKNPTRSQGRGRCGPGRPRSESVAALPRCGICGVLLAATVLLVELQAETFRYTITATGTQNLEEKFNYTVTATGTETWTEMVDGTSRFTIEASGRSSPNPKLQAFVPSRSGSALLSYDLTGLNSRTWISLLDRELCGGIVTFTGSTWIISECRSDVVAGQTYVVGVATPNIWSGSEPRATTTLTYPTRESKTLTAVRTATETREGKVTAADGDKVIGQITLVPRAEKGGTIGSVSYQVTDDSSRVETRTQGNTVLAKTLNTQKQPWSAQETGSGSVGAVEGDKFIAASTLVAPNKDTQWSVVDDNANVETRMQGNQLFARVVAANRPPQTPSSLSPTDGATDQPLTLTLQGGAFGDPDGDTHAASQWQVFNSAGTIVVWDSAEDAINKTSRAVPASANLANATTYRWQVRYKDSRGLWSEYSKQTAFTTARVPCEAPTLPLLTQEVKTATVGQDFTFQLKATAGTPPLAYQWQFNKSPIPGATTDTLLVKKVQLADSGRYDVVVRNACGSATNGLVLSVTTGPTDPSDDFNDNSVNRTFWGADKGDPGNTFTEANGRLEYTKSVTQDGYAERPWIFSSGRYTENWEAQVDVHLSDVSLPRDENDLRVGLAVAFGPYFADAQLQILNEGGRLTRVFRWQIESETRGYEKGSTATGSVDGAVDRKSVV